MQEYAGGDASFAFIAYNKLVEKAKHREEYAKTFVKKGLDFKEDDDYIFDRSKTDWANSEVDLDVAWRKKLKNDILTYKMMDKISSDTSRKDDKTKPRIQSTQLSPEERTLKRLKLINCI